MTPKGAWPRSRDLLFELKSKLNTLSDGNAIDAIPLPLF